MDTQMYKLNMAKFDLQNLLCNYFKINLFTDCTIVCGCGRGLSFHKMILSSSSEFHARLFLARLSDSHPVIIYPDLEFNDLERVAQFIYRGEITLKEEHLEGFLKAGRILKIDGISKEMEKETMNVNDCSSDSSSDSEDSNEDLESDPPMDPPANNLQTTNNKKKQNVNKHNEKASTSRNAFTENNTKPLPTVKSQLKPQKMLKVRCKFCNKKYANRQSCLRHQSECDENSDRVMHTCFICGRSFKRKTRLTLHTKLVHEKASQKIAATENHLNSVKIESKAKL